MCAAPGSKTAQLIEAIHAVEDVVPQGKEFNTVSFTKKNKKISVKLQHTFES